SPRKLGGEASINAICRMTGIPNHTVLNLLRQFLKTNPCRKKLHHTPHLPAFYSATIVCLRCTTHLSEVNRVPGLPRLLLQALVALIGLPVALAVEAPKLVQQEGRWALFVEGHPYLALGGPIHNSGAWPP